MSGFKVVTMDGGAASGKSSTARLLAERLELMHVDTGAHYRGIAHCLIAMGVEPEPLEGVLKALGEMALGTGLEGRSAYMTLNGRRIEEKDLRSDGVNERVSFYAAIAKVRTFLLEYQRGHVGVAREHGFSGVILEGRDCGSVVLPDAPHRYFLEADGETRARRRALEGQTDSIEARDKMDRERKAAPLKCPEGAVRVDTSHLTLEAVVAKIAGMIEND